MNIVIDARLLLPKRTGIGTYLYGLAQGLRQLPGSDRFEFWIRRSLPAKHPIQNLSSGNLTLRQVPIPHMSLHQQWAIPKLLRKNRPDLFHYPHFDMPWLAPVPTVATIHDLKYIARPDFFPQQGRIKRLLMILAMAGTARRACRIIADSENTRLDLIHHLRANPEHIRVVHLGVEKQYFEPPAEETILSVRERYDLRKPFLLCVGERRPHKNLVGLLRAFQAFQSTGQREHELVIVGKRYADYQEPERLAQEMFPYGGIRFLDYVPDQDLAPLYYAADVFALLSFYEGFGLPVLEAMAAGTPVVAARTTSLIEIVDKAGLLVDPEDPQEAAAALSRVISGSPERQHWVDQGLEQSRNFTWKECARKTLDTYHEAVEG